MGPWLGCWAVGLLGSWAFRLLGSYLRLLGFWAVRPLRMTPSPFSKAPKRRLNWTCPLLKSWFCRAWKRFSTHARGREESANLRREENLAAESMSSEHDSVESRRAQSSVVVSSRQSSSRLVAKKPAGVVQGIPPTALVIQLNRAFQHVSQNEIKL